MGAVIHRFLLVLILSGALAPQLQASDWQTIEPGGDTRCATGTPFNFHVRRGASDRLMIFFNGGGACWSAETCDATGRSGGKPSYRPVASAEAGNHPAAFDGAFALDNPDNPFAEWSQVFVSYCTGDVHLGTADRTYERPDGSEFTMHHRGRINAMATLSYVYENFSELDRIFVAGGSAGAISSPIFAALMAENYPEADVVQFAGGGGSYRLGTPTRLWRLWGVFDDLPGLFDDSSYSPGNASVTDLYRMANEASPGIAYHQFDHAYDATQAEFQKALGEPLDPLESLEANRDALRKALPSFTAYTAPGESHTLLRYPTLYEASSNGVRALDWVRRIAEGQPMTDVHCGEAADCR